MKPMPRMAQPVPLATFCRALCRGWPLLVATLLTLLLGWSELHEGRSHTLPGMAVVGPQLQNSPPHPGGSPPARQHALPAGEVEPDTGRHGQMPLLRPLCQQLRRRPAGSGDIRPTEALHFHLPHPRQPPGQAPPRQA